MRGVSDELATGGAGTLVGARDGHELHRAAAHGQEGACAVHVLRRGLLQDAGGDAVEPGQWVHRADSHCGGTTVKKRRGRIDEEGKTRKSE